MKRTERAKKAIKKLAAAFEDGQAFKWIGCRLVNTGRPSDAWSLTNYLLMALSGTEDARGFRQWQEAGRKVTKGAKAIWILAPRMITTGEVVNTETGKSEKEKTIAGFLGVPVFRLEDTQGEPLEYQKAKLPDLVSVAEAWGVSVRFETLRKGAYGSYGGKTIRLQSDAPEVFFHELAHAAVDRLDIEIDYDREEIVAEAVAAGLCAAYGGSTEKSPQNFGAYIQGYAKRMDRKPDKVLLDVLKDCEAVLKVIEETAQQAETVSS